MHIEVGHAAQNVCLQATAMGLGAVTVGAFYDDQVGKILNLLEGENLPKSHSQSLVVIPRTAEKRGLRRRNPFKQRESSSSEFLERAEVRDRFF